MKSRNIYLDWRPWVFLLTVFAVVFWVEIGYYYYQGCIEGAINAEQSNKLLAQHLSWNSFNDNLLAWCISLSMSMLVVGWLTTKVVNSTVNNRSMNSAKDNLLYQIPTCTDPEILEFNSRLGITVSSDSVVIPQEIILTASIEALAHDIGTLLYLHYKEIETLTLTRRYSAFHSLADLLLSNWTESKMQEFVEALVLEKDYIGRSLDAALRRRSLEHQVDRLCEEIERCQEQEVSVTEELKTSRVLVTHFNDYHELKSGKSAIARWFKLKIKNFKARFIKEKPQK